MEFRPLGNTGLRVSNLSLGTAELGMDYGFKGSDHYRKPADRDAIRIIHRALDLGINVIDTARSYGSSEQLVGRALRQVKSGVSSTPLIVTKVVVSEGLLAFNDRRTLRSQMEASIEASLRSLGVEVLDILLIHNASVPILRNDEVLRVLEDARQNGKVRFLGASAGVGEEASLAALDVNQLSALQVPFHLLDTAILPKVLPRAAQQGVGVFTRSAFLRGVLTDRAGTVPDELRELRERVLDIREQLRGEDIGLSEAALRFCLSFEAVTSVVIGVRSEAELAANIAVADRGRLAPAQIEKLLNLQPCAPSLVDPQNWKAFT